MGRWKGAGRMRVEWAAITGRCSRTNLGHVDILAGQVALQQQGDLLELMSRLVQPLSVHDEPGRNHLPGWGRGAGTRGGG